MRIMGLDVGDKRIGVAVSDQMAMTSQGIQTILRTEKKDEFAKIIQLIKDWEIEKIVVGLPRNMNGTYGPQAQKVKDFITELTDQYSLDVVYWDERLTTVAAQKTLLEGNVSRKKRKQVVDKLAAVMILQGFLDSR